MSRNLRELEKIILGEDKASEEWLKIREEVKEALKKSNR